MNKKVILMAIVGCLSGGLSGPVRAEDWKGESDKHQISVGALTGMGIVNSSGGLTLLGTASKKIVERGFVSDLNDSVWIEVMLGPVVLPAYTGAFYSAHIRWDFVKDPRWTLYALGGLSGAYSGSSSPAPAVFTMTPRFGVGTFLKTDSGLSLRGELSHDLIGFGVNFAI